MTAGYETYYTDIKFVDGQLYKDTGNENNSNSKYQFNVYPNPFNPATTIYFDLTKDEPVTLTIFNINGEIVKALVNKVLDKGSYRIQFSNYNLSSGIYFCNLNTK